jgi:hypothetical protein
MTIGRIRLYNIDAICLIVECDSGVIYQNQVGGLVCFQAEQEGVLAPLDVSPEITQLVEDHKFAQGRQGIDMEAADLLDGIFRSNRALSFLSVDRTRLEESWEAWVYVRIGDVPRTPDFEPESTYFGPIYGFPPGRGVVTWPNSD